MVSHFNFSLIKLSASLPRPPGTASRLSDDHTAGLQGHSSNSFLVWGFMSRGGIKRERKIRGHLGTCHNDSLWQPELRASWTGGFSRSYRGAAAAQLNEYTDTPLCCALPAPEV